MNIFKKGKIDNGNSLHKILNKFEVVVSLCKTAPVEFKNSILKTSTSEWDLIGSATTKKIDSKTVREKPVNSTILLKTPTKLTRPTSLNTSLDLKTAILSLHASPEPEEPTKKPILERKIAERKSSERKSSEKISPKKTDSDFRKKVSPTEPEYIRKIYVSNVIGNSIQLSDIETYFSKFGEIEDSYWPKFHAGKNRFVLNERPAITEHKPFLYLTFKSKDAMKYVFRKSKHEICNQLVFVSPLKSAPNDFVGKLVGHFASRNKEKKSGPPAIPPADRPGLLKQSRPGPKNLPPPKNLPHPKHQQSDNPILTNGPPTGPPVILPPPNLPMSNRPTASNRFHVHPPPGPPPGEFLEVHLADNNKYYPQKLLKSIHNSYSLQKPTPFLNTLIIHRGAGETVANYYTNSTLLYLASPNVFLVDPNVSETRLATETIALPQGLNPQALKILLGTVQKP